MLLSLLGLVGAVALYFFLLSALPPRLRADQMRWPLRWAHGTSSAIVLASCLLSWATGWSLRHPWLWLAVLLASGLAAGLRRKLDLVPVWGRFLTTVQASVVPCAAFLFLLAGPGTRCYRDAHLSLEFVQDTGGFTNITTTCIKLYRPQWVFFEEYSGRVSPGPASPYGDPSFHNEYGPPRPGATGIWTRSWWDSVTEVTLDARQRRGTIFQGPESYEAAQTPFTF
ncbi:hypothetical protein Q5H92_00010 [Hymenobacter sp. M29]|uniref:Uncharacterized protein n=1 Tax=Hymenobacter mellowenesis TaxID=3063995 RepID=A0ABT9A4E7_9BACT|nr:hypothetical protein [Hymenobacter sp. M29]MDO7844721.1 hypothetical protein [Hymenobacter sp. M29]